MLLIGRLCQDVGLPKGVLNLLSGFGRPCGEALAKHMDVRKISFTGSQIAGRAIKKAAADSNLKKVTLELGGKSPLIIFPDADLEKAVAAAAASMLMLSGQACVASTRYVSMMWLSIINADLYPEFMPTRKLRPNSQT